MKRALPAPFAHAMETIMDANQRSSINNQSNNGANDKWTAGSEGKTTGKDQPLDHTYPQALGSHQGNQQRDVMGNAGGSHGDDGTAIPGGSMETQVNGGSGTVQGVTDSHERQMQQKSGAWGQLEQPVGGRARDTVDVHPHDGDTVNRGRRFVSDGGAIPPLAGQSDNGDVGGQEAQHGNTQLEVSGSRSMANQESDVGGVHDSNDLAGGLPRSPGNSGARSVDRAGSQTGNEAATHESNDAAGGYPRSPGYANKLSGDQNMDDDTGFKRKP
jgi:hypothetical protein